MNDVRRSEGDPLDRLTALCSEMSKVLEEKGDGSEKCVIFLQDGKRGGLQMFNYEEDAEAIADLFLHLQAIFEANGKTLMFAPMPGSPETN